MSELTLVEFLTARLDEDEAVARAANLSPRWVMEDDLPDAFPGIAAHIARHDPARVLVEVQAKRAIVALHAFDSEFQWCGHDYQDSWPCPTLRLLASVFSDHPDYNEGWKP